MPSHVPPHQVIWLHVIINMLLIMVKHAVDYGGGAGASWNLCVELWIFKCKVSETTCSDSKTAAEQILSYTCEIKNIPRFGLTLLKQAETRKDLFLAFKVESAGVKGRFKPRSGRGKRPFALAEKRTTFFAFYAFLCLIFTPLTSISFNITKFTNFSCCWNFI